MSAEPGSGAGKRLPPVAHAGVVSLALLFAGGIYLASYLPEQPSLVPAVVLLAAAALVMGTSMIALVRSPGFAWSTFWLIARWAALAYGIITGMLVYMFVRNGTRGEPLLVMTLMLLVYALTVVVLISFTVARYDRSRI